MRTHLLAVALSLLAAMPACSGAGPSPSSAASPAAAAPRAPRAPVTLTYLGVAGWRIDDGEHTLLVDPYFTRVDVQDDHAPLVPDAAAIERYAPARADAILVEHSHYDHLLDVPAIAARTGAVVVGTPSTLHVARAAGLPPERLRAAAGGETFAFGPFSVRAVRGLHSLIGMPTTPIPADVTLPMPAERYTEGGTLDYVVQVEGRTVLFIGSANFIESELEGLRPDVAAIAVGVREKVPDYSCRLMRVLGRPPLVLTNHFDAHRRPLGPHAMDIGDDDRADLARFADEIHACAPGTRVVVPEHLHPMAI